MHINFISNKTYPEFELIEKNKLTVYIKIDEETQGFRIKYGDNRRVFFIAEELVKKNIVMHLLTEYSQPLGSILKNKTDKNNGEIEIEGVHYSYKIYDDFLKEINLFQDNKSQPVISCRIDNADLKLINKNYIDYILFSLAWSSFLNKAQPALAQLTGTEL